MNGAPSILANTMATNTGTLTRLHGIDGQWMTNAQLVAMARQIHQRAIDNQRMEAEAAHPPRHEFTPGYFEYPTFDESANFDPVPNEHQVVGRIEHHLEGDPVRVKLTAAGLSLPNGASLFYLPEGIDSEGGSCD